MYLGFQQVTATSSVKTDADFTIPNEATHVELVADTQDVRYTMDDATDPTQTSGMIFGTAHEPKLFVIDDFHRLRFVRGAGSDGKLNAHFVGGRVTA